MLKRQSARQRPLTWALLCFSTFHDQLLPLSSIYGTGTITPTPYRVAGRLPEMMPTQHLARHRAHRYTLRKWATRIWGHSLAFRLCWACHVSSHSPPAGKNKGNPLPAPRSEG